MGDERTRHNEVASVEHAPLPAALRRYEVIALHGHDRRAPDHTIVLVLHAEHEGAQVLKRIAQLPAHAPQPLRLTRHVPAGSPVIEPLLGVVQKPPERVQLPAERLAPAAGDGDGFDADVTPPCFRSR
jgi:hypothetical protein